MVANGLHQAIVPLRRLRASEVDGGMILPSLCLRHPSVSPTIRTVRGTSPKEFTVNVRRNVRLATAGSLLILLGACSSAPVSGSPVSGSKATAVGTAAPEAAVAGDIPDSQAFVGYASSDGYSIKVPEGWARLTDGAAESHSP